MQGFISLDNSERDVTVFKVFISCRTFDNFLMLRDKPEEFNPFFDHSCLQSCLQIVLKLSTKLSTNFSEARFGQNL